MLAGNEEETLLLYGFSLEAASWCSMLAENKKKNWRKKLLKRPPKRKKNQGKGDVRKRVLEGVLGKDWNKVESTFLRMISESKAAWAVTHQVAGRARNQLVLAGSKDHTAQIKFAGTIPDGDFAVRTRATFADVGSKKSMRIVFAKSNKEMLGVIVKPGRVFLSQWNGKWNDLSEGKTSLTGEQPFDISIEVGKTLRVLIDGKLVVEGPVDKWEIRQAVYVAINESLVWLDDLRIEAPRPAPK